jgi:hypothetical protein
MLTLIVVAPAALGLGDADGDAEAEADADADADAEPDGLALPDALAEADALAEVDALAGADGALLDTAALGIGTEHAGALLALGATLLPVESTTCTGRLPCAAVTLTRVTGSWLLLKIQSAIGAFAPDG